MLNDSNFYNLRNLYYEISDLYFSIDDSDELSSEELDQLNGVCDTLYELLDNHAQNDERRNML